MLFSNLAFSLVSTINPKNEKKTEKYFLQYYFKSRLSEVLSLEDHINNDRVDEQNLLVDYQFQAITPHSVKIDNLHFGN